ncbi:DUF4367 domain-containing protein [Paenibacillus senegalensis]|uniref:DUF4367 domain-containing protein n=1 Tax=Paenibacillus senegalensis TaxID=1465766 RepID=UPI000288EF5D|nr:DUF4367 domain-containing protein [Paenibacillus senegalensis]
MNKEQFDQWFDSAFEESVRESSQHPIPEADASWQRISQKLKLQRKRRIRRRRWQMAIAIAASLCVGAFIFGSPQLTKAIEPIKAMITQLSDEMVGIFYGEREEKEEAPDAPPPNAESQDTSWGASQPFAPYVPAPDPGTVQTKAATLEEAIQQSRFSVYTPQYVKKGYDLTGVDLTVNQEGEVVLVNFTYEREDRGDVYLINQSQLQPDSLMNFYKNGEEVVSDIAIGQTQGKLFEGKRSMLVLFHQETLIMIRGALTSEEIQQIAESMISPLEAQ